MKIFVASSASESVDVKYKTLASNLATFLAKQNHKLVFGGFDSGMMGKVFYTFKYENGLVKGISDIYSSSVLDTLECDLKEVTSTTFDRTKKLFQSSDMAIILPGGIGTLAELFSIIDEKRMQKKDYPIILFNYENYFSPLLEFLAKCHNINFTSDEDLKMFDIVTNLESLENYIKEIEKNKE